MINKNIKIEKKNKVSKLKNLKTIKENVFFLQKALAIYLNNSP
jgi:hypothetical protein